MGNLEPKFNWTTVLLVSAVLLAICGIASWFLLKHVTPLPKTANLEGTTAMSFMAAVLAMLAGGCIAGFFSFEYKETQSEEVGNIILVAYILIAGIFLFTFLSMYCLQKADVLNLLDWWAKILLFISIYLVLVAIVLLERWDATTLPVKDSA